jgi:hypothetical protein
MIARLARAIVRRLVPFVSRRPTLVALAARAFIAFPSLKLRLRALASRPLPAATSQLDDAQLRVLIDLREAVRPPR